MRKFWVEATVHGVLNKTAFDRTETLFTRPMSTIYETETLNAEAVRGIKAFFFQWDKENKPESTLTFVQIVSVIELED